MASDKSQSPKVVLPGSERKPLGSRIGDVPASETIDVSVIFKPQNAVRIPAIGEPHLTREELEKQHGPDHAAVKKLEAFAASHNLKVKETSFAKRTVVLEGSAADLSNAFNVQLHRYHHDGCDYRGRTGSVHIPEELAGSIEAVLGLDTRQQAKTHFRILDTGTPTASPHATGISYTPVQVAKLYNFPTGVDGTGQTIGILELGGGYKAADLKNYFASIAVKQPVVTAVLVDKAKNNPTTSNSADGEVLLDIEVAGAVAPGAHIVVYFAPNTDKGFLDALTTAIHDKTNKPSVISISWGGPESAWTAQAMTAFDTAAQDAAALGVTICAASGDSGSSDGVAGGGDHVDFPSSSPHILACGGTKLQSTGGKITSETVWNEGTAGGAGGGGFSVQFPLPSWQSSVKITPPTGGGRGVPDVSGDADPQTGYQVLVDGQKLVIGGTSAVAPLWSGLIALFNQKLGKPLGFLQPALYGLPASSGAFHDITAGSNGTFSAKVGWDAASGLGSPLGTNLLTALSKTATKRVT